MSVSDIISAEKKLLISLCRSKEMLFLSEHSCFTKRCAAADAIESFANCTYRRTGILIIECILCLHAAVMCTLKRYTFAGKFHPRNIW